VGIDDALAGIDGAVGVMVEGLHFCAGDIRCCGAWKKVCRGRRGNGFEYFGQGGGE